MKTAIELITEERQRQIEKEGWSLEHDDSHKNGELADAAGCYALTERKRNMYASYSFEIKDKFPRWWPFNVQWWKPEPNDRIKELVKSGALIVAEIERLQRSNF